MPVSKAVDLSGAGFEQVQPHVLTKRMSNDFSCPEHYAETLLTPFISASRAPWFISHSFFAFGLGLQGLLPFCHDGIHSPTSQRKVRITKHRFRSFFQSYLSLLSL